MRQDALAGVSIEMRRLGYWGEDKGQADRRAVGCVTVGGWIKLVVRQINKSKAKGVLLE